MNIFNRLFKADYSVCAECGAHFDPVTGYEETDRILCAIHRKPVLELKRRKQQVMWWAELNWEKLEAQARKEDEDSRVLYGYQLGAGCKPEESIGGMRQCTNPEAIRQANLQNASGHNHPFLWPYN